MHACEAGWKRLRSKKLLRRSTAAGDPLRPALPNILGLAVEERVIQMQHLDRGKRIFILDEQRLEVLSRTGVGWPAVTVLVVEGTAELAHDHEANELSLESVARETIGSEPHGRARGVRWPVELLGDALGLAPEHDGVEWDREQAKALRDSKRRCERREGVAT